MQNSIERIQLIPPNVDKSKVIGCNVGFRPYRRGGPKMDFEKIGNKIIFHNYGHGGGGVSIGYGCAKYVVTQFVANYGTTHKKLAVLGSGFLGLFTSILLADLGYDVNIYANNFPIKFGVYTPGKQSLTSQTSGGIWSPFGYDVVNKPLHDIYTRDTFDYFKKCIEDNKYKGLSFKKVYKIGDTKNPADLYIPAGLINDRKNVEVTFGNGVYIPALTYTTIMMDSDIFLNELMNEAITKNIKMNEKDFESSEQLEKLEENVIFNCSGNGALKLFNDKNVYPIKGQLLYLKKTHGFDYFLQTSSPNGTKITAYPQDNKTAIGISYEKGVTNPEADHVILEEIRKNMEEFLEMKLVNKEQ